MAWRSFCPRRAPAPLANSSCAPAVAVLLSGVRGGARPRPPSCDLDLSPCKLLEFPCSRDSIAKCAELFGRVACDSESAYYLKPALHNFPAVDALVPGFGALQVTVSRAHKVQGARFKAFLAELRLAAQASGQLELATLLQSPLSAAEWLGGRLVFVVPAEQVSDMREQEVVVCGMLA